MKVLHVDVEKLWRGGQQQAVYLYEEMLKKGMDTGFVCVAHSKLASYFEKNKLPYHTVRFFGEMDVLSGHHLAKYAKENDYQLLHLHSSHSLSLGLWTKFWHPSLVLVASRRVDFPIRKNLFSSFKYNTVKLNKIVAISDNIKNVLLNDGIPESKIAIIHSGIDTTRHLIPDPNEKKRVSESVRKQWGIPHNALVVGTVAALAGHKDYPTLLAAAQLVLKQRNDVYFLAVGDGLLLEKMKELATEYNIEQRFIFTGYQKNIKDYLNCFDIFVLASKKEGLGTSLLDAQSVGLPVIGANSGGIPEIITDKVDGLLFPSQEPQELANKLFELLADEELRVKLGKNAAVNVKRFDKSITADENTALYKKLLKKKK